MESNTTPQASLNSIRLIVGAMMAGVVIFGIIGLTIGPLTPDADDSTFTTMLPLVALAMAVPASIAYFAIPAFVFGNLRKRYENGEISNEELPRLALQSLVTASLLRAAMIEGVCLFALVITLMIGIHWVLALVIVGLFGMVSLLPGPSSVDALVSSCTGRFMT